jgi:hypothetical protein
MKNRFLLKSTLLLTFILSSHLVGALDLSFGVKGGLQAQKMNGDGLKNVYSTGPLAGAFINLNKHRIGLQLESIWSQNEITTDSSFYGLYKQYYNRINDSLKVGNFRFQTISLPILLNIKLTQKFWLQLGPQYSSNVSIIDKSDLIESGIKILKNNNYNFIGGFWFQTGGESHSLKLNMGARIIVGLNNINTINTYEVWTNQIFQVHLGISY